MSEWDKVAKPVSADWDGCAVPVKSEAQQRREKRREQQQAIVEAQHKKQDLVAQNAYKTEMAAVQDEMDAIKMAESERARKKNNQQRELSVIARNENFALSQQETALAMKEAEAAEERRQRAKILADKLAEDEHNQKIIDEKRAAQADELERRGKRRLQRDYNLRAARRVDTTKSYSKKALIIGGTAFVLWMLFKVAQNFDAFFLPPAPPPPVHEQGATPAQPQQPQPAAEQGQGQTQPPAQNPPFVPGQTPQAPYEPSSEGKVKGSDGKEYEHSSPEAPYKHSGEGEGKKGENPADWGWERYFPQSELKPPSA